MQPVQVLVEALSLLSHGVLFREPFLRAAQFFPGAALLLVPGRTERKAGRQGCEIKWDKM